MMAVLLMACWRLRPHSAFPARFAPPGPLTRLEPDRSFDAAARDMARQSTARFASCLIFRETRWPGAKGRELRIVRSQCRSRPGTGS